MLFQSRLTLAVMLVGLVALTGCLTPLLMSESSTPIEGRTYRVIGPATAESCQESIIGIPIATDASLQSTLDAAQKSISADALIEVVVDRWTLVTFVYNRFCTVVHAKGIRFGASNLPYLAPVPAVPALPSMTDSSELPVVPLVQPSNTGPASRPIQAATVSGAEKANASEPAPLTKAQILEEKKKKEVEAKAQALEKKRQAEEEKRKVAEEKKKAEEAAKQEAIKRRLDDEAKKKAEIEAKKKAAEEAKKRAEDEIKNKAAEEARKKNEEEAKKKAEEEAKRKAEDDARREEEQKPVPEEFWTFCKFQAGDVIRVEAKAELVEAEFVECVHFGVRVKQKGKNPGVIPFDQIWSVSKSAASPAKPAQPAQPATPAVPKTPAQPTNTP